MNENYLKEKSGEISIEDLRNDNKFSFFNSPITNTIPSKTIDLPEVYGLLKGDKYRLNTQRYRVDSENVKRELKSTSFDYVTFSGIFNKRCETELIQHSELMVFDFDDVSDINELKNQLLEDTNFMTGLLFRSPSGKGLKWVIKIDLEKATHKQWFQAVSNYIKKTYSVEVDSSGKDVSRACFLCHDPEAYLNPAFSEEGQIDLNSFENEKFNPKEWLKGKPEKKISSATPIINEHYINEELINEVEKAVSAIEQKRIDLTAAYPEWRNIGFALADSLGELGRPYYHRISQFYPKYDAGECDKQYQKCLESNGSGITLNTLFYLVNKAEIETSSVEFTEPEVNIQLPTIPEKVYDGLPVFFKKITGVTSIDYEKDILLLGSIVTLSSSMHMVHGVYNKKSVYPNLFFFLEGNAGSGKSILEICKELVMPIHEGNNSLNPEIENQPKRLLIIPANISAAGIYLLLNQNEGRGLIFETEADTLADKFNNKEFGNFSDGLRKAFHHESMSSFRKKDNELIEVKKPKLSVVLSGTPKQTLNLISDAENGLFSRFIFYSIPMNIKWKNVFEESDEQNLDEFFTKLGEEYYPVYQTMEQTNQVKFDLTKSQKDELNTFFEHKQEELVFLIGTDFNATVRRLALITFRMAMVFTTVRALEDDCLSDELVCNEVDFRNALTIGEILINHSKHIYQGFPQKPMVRRSESLKEKFYRLLPKQFKRENYVALAESLKLNIKTAENYIQGFIEKGLLNRYTHNLYLKLG